MTYAAIGLLLAAAGLQSRLIRIYLARALLRLAGGLADRILTNVERERGQ